jgi:ABC-type nitrate/sulfonate/bicarbonate transport system substrate-binding protein
MRSFGALVLFGMVSLAASATRAGDRVTFAIPGLIMADLAIHYAVDEGFMKQAGLDAELLQTERSDLSTMAVLSGDATASATDPAQAAIALARGARLRVIAGLAVNAPPFLVGDASVTSDQSSWKGKTVALFTPPNTLYTLFIRELKKGGWQEIEKNVFRKDAQDGLESYLHISFGKRGTELPALLAGRANISILHEPDASTAIIRGNLTKLRAFSSDFEQILWTTLNTSADAIDKNPKLIAKIVTGLNAALSDMNDHPEKVADFAAKLFGKADPEVVKSAVRNLLAAGVFPKDCMITEAGWKSNVDLIKLTAVNSKAADVNFSEIANTQFCMKALGR